MADHASDNATTGAQLCPVCQSPRPDLGHACPHCGAPPVEGAEGERREGAPRPEGDRIFSIRASDIEPYVGLRYLSKLFKLMAIILALLLVAEVVTGLSAQGSAAIPTLLPEVSRLIVLAGVLWGVGDLAILLIDVGHDVRASRILLGRQTSHQLRPNVVERPATPPRAVEPDVSDRREARSGRAREGDRHP